MRAAIAVAMIGISVAACSKNQAGAPGPAPEAGTVASAASEAGPASSAPAPELSARIPVGVPLNAPRAEAMAMQYAARRWPQYHPRMASAFHGPTYWRVVIEFQEPNVGAFVQFDQNGVLMDAGTSTGEH